MERSLNIRTYQIPSSLCTGGLFDLTIKVLDEEFMGLLLEQPNDLVHSRSIGFVRKFDQYLITAFLIVRRTGFDVLQVDFSVLKQTK